jgi:hypothetical protein
VIGFISGNDVEQGIAAGLFYLQPQDGYRL